jgi:hypothetical protein
MVPSVFAPIDRLPLTNSVKVDRPALARLAGTPGLQVVTGSTAASRPADPDQAAVAKAWCAVLERDSVGLDDHFLDAGGTSLMLSSLCARLTAIGAGELTVVDLIEHATVRAQAALLSAVPNPGGA